MKLTEEDLKAFQEMVYMRFGREISKEEALTNANKLIRLMQIILEDDSN